MKIIYTKKRQEIYVDSHNHDWLSIFRWHITGDGYAYTNIKGDRVPMHKLVARNFNTGLIVDHINRVRLDNREKNLRLVTYAQNLKNQKIRMGGTSKYKGVSFCKRDNKWKVQICSDYRKIYIGRFEIEKDAAIAYNEAAKKYHGEYANINSFNTREN